MIKKMFLTVVGLMTMMGAFAYETWTDPETGIQWKYVVKGADISVGGGSWSNTAIPQSTSGDIVIPSEIANRNVTSIGDYAFYRCDKLGTVTIPSSVTKIGSHAFHSCYQLDPVSIPSSVTNIGESAFSYCKLLGSVTIPSSVICIGDSAFTACDNLYSITISPGVKHIGAYAFSWCDSLTSISLPLSILHIGEGAFAFCCGLTTLVVDPANENYCTTNGVLFDKNKTLLICYPAGKEGAYDIPLSVTCIGESAFGRCQGLSAITIPLAVTNIGNNAFYHCDGLREISIPSNVMSIGSSAFSGCRGLTTLILPPCLTSLSPGLCYDCDSLSSIAIPLTVTSIMDSAFAYSGITSIAIPPNVTNIEVLAFSGCRALTKITVDSNNLCYCVVDGVLYSKDMSTLVCCPGGMEGVCNIPNGVTQIRDFAFQYCENLTAITIPQSVDYVGCGTFSSCENLSVIDFGGSPPEGLVDAEVTAPIRYNAIYEDDWLPVIEDCCFLSATSYYPEGFEPLPDGVMVEMVDGVYWYYAHRSWGNSYSSYTISDEVMVGFGESSYQIHVNAVSTNTQGTIVVPSSLGGFPVTKICSYAFRNCKGVTAITVPACVAEVGSQAFVGCSSLNQ